jgi:hypothetical protein
MAYLNSSLGRYLCKRYVSILDNGGYLMQKVFVDKIPINKFSDSEIQEITSLCKENLKNRKVEFEEQINDMIFQSYSLTENEVDYIKNDNTEGLLR